MKNWWSYQWLKLGVIKRNIKYEIMAAQDQEISAYSLKRK
jgi:hypothetical protein